MFYLFSVLENVFLNKKRISLQTLKRLEDLQRPFLTFIPQKWLKLNGNLYSFGASDVFYKSSG